MKQDFYYLSKDGKTKIHATEWIPEGSPRAILQICHGMVEYIGRYADFAQYLSENGFYVTGNDLLGHGESVVSDDMLGFFGKDKGNEYVIGDIHELRCRTAEKYPDVPYFMLGHSMGSFLLRQYIEMYGKDLKGAIIMGTGNQSGAVLKAGKMLCRTMTAFRGEMYRSTLINNMAIGSYNKRFEPARTTHDWLTRDEQIVDQYLANPWCTFMFTANAYYHMFRGIEYLQDPAHLAKVPKGLPLLVVSGAEDPVGDFGKGVTQVYEIYKNAGIRDLQMKLYPSDRHEILNELDRQLVYEDLKNWMEERL